MSFVAAFTYESQMLELVLDYLPAILEPKYNGCVAVPELQINGRIPDVTLLSFDQQAIMPHRKKLTATQAHVLQAISRLNEALITEVADEIILSESRLLNCFDVLEKGGFIKKTEDETYRVSNDVREQRVEILAVEMKLRDWRSALQQACSYTEFADRSYVILDGLQITPKAETLEAYEGAGIGLILQLGWQLEPLVQAQEQRPGSPHRFIAIQKLLSRYQNNSTIQYSHAIS